MKILMIGLGSIGQRHLRNIRRIYGTKAEIIAYRVRGFQHAFSDAMQIRDGVVLEDEYNITSYSDLNEALSCKPDAAFITNVTSKHIEAALVAAEAGCHLFIEKPLSDSLEGCGQLAATAKERGLTVFMGFQNRYHICILKMKELLENNILGNIISADAVFGERLTTMHTYEDYRTTYMARKELGGGPINNLQAHDLDCLNMLLGKPVSVYSIIAKNSDLEIDVEDSCSSVFEYETSNGFVPVISKTDFLQYPPKHTIEIVCDKGRMEADLIRNSLIVYKGDDILLNEIYNFERNDMFISELKDFFKAIEKKESGYADINAGILSLKMAMAQKLSYTNKRQVRIEEI